MFNKYRNKKKFVDRGVYFITTGEYKGAFILHIKECDQGENKALMMLPDKEQLLLPSVKIKELFEQDHFEYVRTIPKKVYKVCVAEYKESLK
jgi:hypothetical protein